MQRRAQELYVALLLVVALASGVVFHFGTWVAQVAACRSVHRPGAYLAYCSHPLYGSYEHDAYGLGLEPGAVRALQRAQVIFLGNSRTQFAFSTPQVEQFFRERSVSYHLLGFGYAETGQFAKRLLDRYRPAPRVIVINADPFFTAGLSPPAQAAIGRGPTAWADAVRKKAFAAVSPILCRIPRVCSEAYGALYRDTRSGQWIWHDVLIPRSTLGPEITANKVTPWSENSLSIWQQEAEAFLSGLALPRSCVILTAPPTPQIFGEGIAAALGQRLSLPVILPDVSPVSSPDNNHLSSGSAERWSAAFLSQAGPLIDACLKDKTHSPGTVE